MSDIAVGGPLAVDLFGIGGSWRAQEHANDDTADHETGDGENGDEVADKLFNDRNEISVDYKHFGSVGNLAIPNLGDVSNGYVKTQLVLTLAANAWPILKLTGHQHDANAHSTGLNVYAFPLTIAAGFGVKQLFADVSGTAGRVGAVLTFSVEHLDEIHGEGEHLAGQNRKGVLGIELTYTGTPDIAAAVAAAGYTILKKTSGGKNSGLNTTVYSLRKAIARN